MKWLQRGLIGIVAVIVIGIGGLYATGKGALLALFVGYVFGKPDLPFLR